MPKRSSVETDPHHAKSRHEADKAPSIPTSAPAPKAMKAADKASGEEARDLEKWKADELIEEAVAPPVTKRRPIDLIDEAKSQLSSLTGFPVDTVSGFAKADDGWRLTITAVELSRIPNTGDVLADYDVSLDMAGDIVSYHRGRRYLRSQVGDAE